VEVEFLFAGYGLAVTSGRVEGPLLNRGDDSFVDAVTEPAGHFDVGNLARRIDNDVEDDVAFSAAGEGGEVGLWRREVPGESDVDVAGSEGVRPGGGVRIG